MNLEMKLKAALDLDLNYSDYQSREELRMGSAGLKPAAVLLLFGFSEDKSEGESDKSDRSKDTLHWQRFSLLYTLRTEQVEHHKGQMAFPGGYCEVQDRGDPANTAVRETEEEVGISRELIQVIGTLPSLPTLTGFLIQPCVGILKAPIENVSLRLNTSEIADAVWVPFDVLLAQKTYQLETLKSGLMEYSTHVYQVDRFRIWGATGSITKNLLDRLRFLS